MKKRGREPRGKYIRSLIFGFNDGTVSNLALVAGLSGAMLGNKIVILGGLADMIAGAISMGLGNYIATKSQMEFYHRKYLKVNNMMEENPVSVGGMTFFAFLIAAFIPVLPFFFFPVQKALLIASVTCMSLLFLIGVSKSRFTGHHWFKSGIEMVIVGAIATLVSYYLGEVFNNYLARIL